jgi:integrase
MPDDTRPSALADGAQLVRERVTSRWGAPYQARRVDEILERFVEFVAAVSGTGDSVGVSPALARSFVSAAEGRGPASLPLQHLRRSALRLLFKVLRDEGADVGDPTIDLQLPPRTQLSTRPLDDDEVALCRGHALWSLGESRRAAAWALAEATARSVEVGQIRVADVDLDGGRVWIHGGRTTRERWGGLSSWGVTHLGRRIAALGGAPESLLVYGGSGGYATAQVSACTAVFDVLERAGLAAEPDVRPASVAAWAGRRILDETGRIDVVAERLGMASLDRTARFIGWDWRSGS